jgi:tryptophanyl-tRNA synthetase
LHLGNYLGAIKNWVGMQDDYECIYCIVDLHAITVAQDPTELFANTREVTAGLIASGIDPERSIIFNQSQVASHAELAWLFNCITPLGWLNRMTQFKEKAGKKRENAVLGLYAYPVLMAADILLYRATHVPVGEDQKQHLELSRDIAAAFNRLYNQEYFPLPEPLILGEAKRVMSLRDGRAKMSKSELSENSRINLTDDAKIIQRKIRRAKTDSDSGMSLDAENRPEAANLLGIYAALNDESIDSVAARFAGKGFADFKIELADLATAKLEPIAAEMRRLMAAPDHIDNILRTGGERAAAMAAPNLAEIKKIIGLLDP